LPVSGVRGHEVFQPGAVERSNGDLADALAIGLLVARGHDQIPQHAPVRQRQHLSARVLYAPLAHAIEHEHEPSRVCKPLHHLERRATAPVAERLGDVLEKRTGPV